MKPFAFGLLTALLACQGTDGAVDREALMDSANCKECHPDHYQQWLGSMHAYAGEDPVFRAMNARGQRETGGALGDFCVRCHAPVAVMLGETNDGLNLDDVPLAHRGVTCFACHAVTAVEGTHNNPLRLATDGILRGEYSDPVANEFHEGAYSPFVDHQTLASSDMCGACHDIVNGHGVPLERTYAEYLASFYADPDPDNPQLHAYYGNTCASCHMPGKTGPIADYPGVKARRFQDHRMVGQDIALTPFPDAEQGPALVADQLAAMKEFREPSLCAGLCVRPSATGGTDIALWLHNEAAGHNWPSGASQDRRGWVELQAFAGDAPVLQTGVVGPQESIDVMAAEDPNLWMFRDYPVDARGEPTHMFWEVTDYTSSALTIPATSGQQFDRTTWVDRVWHVDGPVDRATVVVHSRPIPFELVDELVPEGLDPAIKALIPTHTLGATELEWTMGAAEPTDSQGMCVASASCFDVIAKDPS